MLDPDDRLLLLDALRPPAGYAFDRAVGTSFTLDLHALLTTPLALAAFDWEAADGSIPDDPVAMLESLRRCSDRIDVFCQAGEVGLPPTYHRLYAWLEQSVHECSAPNKWALFHPKVWVLRYRPVESDDTCTYRMLCASRNLTFDRNWDILLVLDGSPSETSANGAPVSDFVRRLPALAVQSVAAARRAEIVELATEIADCRFNPPDGFDEVNFHFLGFGTGSPLPVAANRLLVVSPYVTEDALDLLIAVAPQVDVISRAEELDRLSTDVLRRCSRRFVLSPAAVPSGETGDGQVPTRPLVGLHAKLYVSESRSASWFVGSANATRAAFGGNVEALVELSGPKRKVGIDALLAGTEGNGLIGLLQEHPLPEQPTEPTEAEELQWFVDGLRRAIAVMPATVEVHGLDDDRFSMSVHGGVTPTIEDGSATIVVRPLSLPTGVPIAAGEPIEATFGPVAFETITSFLVFEIVARRGGVVVTDSFVLRAELRGAPRDRADRLLASLLATRRDVLRYLLFLLADAGGLAAGEWQVAIREGPESAGKEAGSVPELPLLETLLRSASRDPGKLVSVERFARSLRGTAEGRNLLPDGFDKVWSAIWEATGKAGTR